MYRYRDRIGGNTLHGHDLQGYDRLTEPVHVRFPISKKAVQPDGSIIIAGKVTDGTVDRDGQIVDPKWAAKALKEWFQELGGPVRQQHAGNYPPAGRCLDLDIRPDGAWIRAKIIEPNAVKMVQERIFRDLSIGIFDPTIYPDPVAPGGRIGNVDDPEDKSWVGECSVVDLGSNKNSHFAIAKRASREARGEVFGVAALPKISRSTRRRRMPELDEARVQADLAAAITGAQHAGDIAGAAVAAAVTKAAMPGLAKDADDDLDDAIDELLGDLSDAVEAQGEDETEDPGKPSDDAVDAALDQVGDDLLALSAVQAADQAGDEIGKAAGKPCSACAGSGEISGVKCMKCSGTGMKARKAKKAKDVPDHSHDDEGDVDKTVKKAKEFLKAQKAAAPCSTCGGDGKIKGGKVTCPDCGGSGLAKNPKKEGKTIVDAVSKGKKPPKGKGKLKPTDSPDLPSKISDDAPAPGTAIKTADPAAQRIHDTLCPAWSHATVKSSYPGIDGLAPVDVLNPQYFADRLKSLTDGATVSRPDSVGAAYQAYAAAHKLASLKAPTFEELRDQANKSFMDAYPTVNLKPGMISPEDFHRGFLPSANPETSSTTRVPNPDLEPSLDADQFRRSALTDNETRPTLSGGSAVTGYSGKGKKANKRSKATKDADMGVPVQVPSRLFYRNVDKDQWSSAMSLLHDHIVDAFPGVCPMVAVQSGSEIDSDGLMGSPAEMNAAPPGLPALSFPSTSGAGRMVPTKAAEVDRGAAVAQIDKAAVKALIDERVNAVRKADRKRFRKEREALKSTIAAQKKELSRPDPRFAPDRGRNNFRPHTDRDTALKAVQAKARITELRTRAMDRDSAVAARAQEALRAQMTPQEFAALAVSDGLD